MMMTRSNRRQFLGHLGLAAAGGALLASRPTFAWDVDPRKREPRLVPPGEGRSVWWMGDDRITFQALGEDTAGAYSFWVDEPPAGVGPPRHVHSREDEGFYVIDGTVEFVAGSVRSVATPGTFLALPCGIPHGWVNGDRKAKLITFTPPAGNEGFFLDLGRPGDGPAGPRATMPVDEINRKSKRYGVTYLGPSPDPASGTLPLADGRRPTVVKPGEGESLVAAGVTYTIKVGTPETAASYSLTELAFEPGGSIPSHRHPRYEEGLYVLGGAIRVASGGRTFEAGPGSFVSLPWGTEHAIDNTGQGPARVLSLTTPGGIEEFYRRGCRKPSDPPGGVAGDLERLRSTGARYGIFPAE